MADYTPLNTIDLITKYSTDAWDEVYKVESISKLLDAPAAMVKWTGAKTVKIAKFQASGMGNYYRNNGTVNSPDALHSMKGETFGYTDGSVGLTWEERVVACDRQKSYPIEKFDDEETDGLVVGIATKEISRTIMIPEIDAYCFSKVAENAGTTKAEDLTANTVYNSLIAGLENQEDNEVPADNQLVLISTEVQALLRTKNAEMSRMIELEKDKSVKFTLSKFEGRDLAVVPPRRFKTDITLTENGYTFGENTKDINFMIVAKDAVMHVVKYNKVKVVGGDLNLAGRGFDGYTIYARVYHDVFVLDNKKYGIYASVKDAAANKTLAADPAVLA